MGLVVGAVVVGVGGDGIAQLAHGDWRTGLAELAIAAASAALGALAAR